MKIKYFLAIVLVVLLIIYFGIIALIHSVDPFIKWNWDEINTSNVSFPEDFIWGVATSAYQVEGGFISNNWTWWEKQTNPDGSPTILNGDTCGKADDN